MRVMHVLEALEGGTSRHLVDVVTHTHAADHDVVIPPRRVGGMTDERAASALRSTGATVHILDMRRTPWAPANGAALRSLARLIRQRRPDVVHGHSSIGGLLTRLPAVTAGRPLVYTPNGLTTVPAGLVAERVLGGRTDRWVAVSESEGALALEHRLVPPSRLVIIQNGVDLAAPTEPSVDLRSQLGLPPATPLVGTISRLVDQKAPTDFVAACAEVARRRSDVAFLLIGGGPLQGAVDAAVEEHDLRSRFHQIGSLPGAGSALGQLDVFALASRFEGGPYAPLEAMRAGTAVVLTDVVGNRDVVEHETSGLLVPFADPEALGTAVVSLLEDGARRARLAEAGRRRLAERFDVRTMGSRLDDLYASCRGRR